MSSNSNFDLPTKNWPEDGIEKVSGCPICNSCRKQVLYSGLTDKVFYCAPGLWPLVKCKGCGCAYLNLRPDRETIQLAYRNYYTHQADIVNPKDISSFSFFRYCLHALANGYRNKRFGSDFSPAWKVGSLISRLFPGRRKKLDRRLRNLPRLKEGARLLDVGFGSGTFLKLARDMGWSVFGVDPDPVVIDSAQRIGLEVRQGGIEAYTDMQGSFDVITLSHVIEHVYEPQTILQEAFNLLKPGGMIWIETPNIESFGHSYFGRNWRGLEPPRHLVIFNWNTLESLLEKAGFERVQRIVNNNYTNIAKKSRALIDGCSPYDKRAPVFSDNVRGLFLKYWIKFDHTKSEFITLTAEKPSVKCNADSTINKSS